MKIKRRLLVSMVLALVFAAFSATGITIPEKDGIHFLAFTSDTHYDMEKPNKFADWMNNLRNVVDNIEYMGFCGDLGSAYAAVNPGAYWGHVDGFMKLADGFVDSGFVVNKNLFSFGNHEWYTAGGGDYAKYNDSGAAKRLLPVGEAAKTDNYIIYSFGPIGTESSYGCEQQFTDENIKKLGDYLKAAPENLPIFIMGHFPIHTWEKRVSLNADRLIDTLNNHPNVIYLWGHNHSNSDTFYDKVFSRGYSIPITENRSERIINFTYAAAGCMSDIEYRMDDKSIPGGANVKGKGMLVAIDGANVTMAYYGINGETIPGASFNTKKQTE